MAERGIRKLASGKFEVRVYAGREAGRDKQKRKVFGSLEEAKRWKRTMAGLRADARDLPNDQVTVAEFLEQWLAANKPVPGRPEASRWRETTYNLHSQVVYSRIVPGIGSLRLSRVTPSVLQAFYRTLATRGLSGTTILNTHSVLRRAFRQAVRDGVISRNPASADAMDAPKKSTFTPTVLDAEQVRLLLAEAKRSSRYYGLYLASVTTGLRQGELLGLDWGDVNLTLGEIRIQRTLYRLGARILLNPPKSVNSSRVLPLVPVLAAELQRLRAEQTEAKAVLGPAYTSGLQDAAGKPLDLVFAGPTGRPLQGEYVTAKDLPVIAARARVPRIRFHDLRHACASFLISLGVDPGVVSRTLGHHAPSMTPGTYTHRLGTQGGADPAARAALAKLEATLGLTPEQPGT